MNSDNKSGISIFKSIEEMSGAIFDFLVDEFTLALSEQRNYHLALSGGSTPVKIFQRLSRLPLAKMKWNFLHVYWGDERCVPPNDTESNYGNMWNAILRYMNIPGENIHRIHGENDPELESKRYSEVLMNHVPSLNGFPRFDLILLGVGEDGHTASIFPGAPELFDTNPLCYVATHPQTNQKRITLSLKLLNNSGTAIFIATGNSKAGVLKKIINKEEGFQNFPAAYVRPENGELKWFLDVDAAKEI